MSRAKRTLAGIDLNTNPMKPVTSRNLGKNLEKDHNRYKPHIGMKQKAKAAKRS